MHIHTAYKVLSGKRILIVEDEPTIAEIITMFAQQLDMQPEIVTSQQQALTRFQDRSMAAIDMVISDIQLDEGTGFELARELRHASPCLPIVLSSGHPFSADDFPYREAIGEITFLNKPFRFAALLEALYASIKQVQT